jgi:hypothetical protein
MSVVLTKEDGMAKPRVFVSSTYFDLKHIRNSLEAFIEGLGYEPVLFESGDIPFKHDQPIDKSCYAEISYCHILVLIIGNRYGSPSPLTESITMEGKEKLYQKYNSVTKEEYDTARKRDIPIFIFVDKSVLAEYETFKKNRENASITYAHVDSVNIFRLLDAIMLQERNNFVRGFEKFDDIADWLRDQWAGIFADHLAQRGGETTLKDLSAQIDDMKEITSALKSYTESIMHKVDVEGAKSLIGETDKKLRTLQVSRFITEPLIEHLRDACGIHEKPDDLFSEFEMSSTLDDFLTRIKMKRAVKFDFLKLYEDPARRDFKKMKQKYGDSLLSGETKEEAD